MSSRKLRHALAGIAAAVLIAVGQPASATSLDDAAFVIPQNANIFGGSRAVPNYSAAFSPYVDSSLLGFTSFAGDILLSGQLTLEVAKWAPTNTFGVFNSANQFTALLAGSATAGSTYSQALGAGQYTFGFLTNAGYWSSIAANNTDGQAHIIGQRVTKNGSVGLNGGIFNVTAGDYVLYLEDLFGGFPHSDRDFDDAIIVVRSSSQRPAEVPEPATAVLLSSAALGLISRRRLAARSSL